MSSTKSDAVRPRRPRPVTLTARDERVARLVADLGIATVNQVQLLEFGAGNRSLAQTRLGVLRRAGILDVLPGRIPNEPAVYVITHKGRQLLGLGTSPEGLRARRIHYGRLRHDLAVNDCRVQVLRAACEPGVRLLRWLDEEALRPLTLQHGLVPDGWFQVERVVEGEAKRSAYFLEAEVSEKGEKALRQKLTSTGAFLFSGKYAEIFETKALRVLILIRPGPGTSAPRLVERMTGLARLVGVHFVRVAELETFLALAPAEVFTAPIWRQPGIVEPVALFQKGGANERVQAA